MSYNSLESFDAVQLKTSKFLRQIQDIVKLILQYPENIKKYPRIKLIEKVFLSVVEEKFQSAPKEKKGKNAIIIEHLLNSDSPESKAREIVDLLNRSSNSDLGGLSLEMQKAILSIVEVFFSLTH